MLLTIKEAARESRFSESYIRQQIRSGQLRTVKFGRHHRIFAEELRRFIERKNAGSQNGIPASNIDSYNFRRSQVIETTKVSNGVKR